MSTITVHSTKLLILVFTEIFEGFIIMYELREVSKHFAIAAEDK